MARLDHPGVVWIHDHGVASDGSPWIAIELASGGALDRAEPRGWAGVRQLLEELLPALRHAHARGVLHRDLKPANVLLCTLDDARPGPKLCDSSLASVAGARGPRGGTPDYLAPEQRDGRWADEGPWTDLYAFGGLVWTLVCGGPPTTTPWAPRFTVPPELRGWVQRLRADAVPDRFASAEEAREALSRISSGVADPASAPTFDDPDGARRARRHPKRAPASMALLGLRPVPVVGRLEERRALTRLLRGLSHDDPSAPRALRLVGGPGVGKSHLVQWLATTAREQDTVDVVWWGQRGEGLAASLRELARRPGAPTRPPEPPDPPPLARLLAWVGAARRPALVLVDPGAPEDARLLRLAADRTRRVAVVATARAADPIRDVEDLALGPHPDPGAIARALGVGDAATLDQVRRRAAGAPGAVVALVRELAARGDLVEGEDGLRLRPGAELPVDGDPAAAVPTADRPALALLALLDGAATEAEWRAACETAGVEGAARAIDRARRRGLVTWGGDHPRLADEPVREALAAEAEGRPEWARAAAEALQVAEPPEPGASPHRVGRAGSLWFLAGELPRALPSLLFAGRYGADTPERRDLLLRRAEAAARAAPPAAREDQIRSVRRARIAEWSNRGDHERAAEAAVALDDPSPFANYLRAAVLLREGFPHRALRWARAAVATLPPTNPVASSARLELARVLAEIGRFEEARALAAGDDPIAVTLRATCLALEGQVEAAGALLDAAPDPERPKPLATLWLDRLQLRVARGLAGWDDAEDAWSDPLSFAGPHDRVSLAVIRVLAAALRNPAELPRAEADLRAELAADPMRSALWRWALEQAAAATTGAMALRLADLAAGQAPLDGPEDEDGGP